MSKAGMAREAERANQPKKEKPEPERHSEVMTLVIARHDSIREDDLALFVKALEKLCNSYGADSYEISASNSAKTLGDVKGERTLGEPIHSTRTQERTSEATNATDERGAKPKRKRNARKQADRAMRSPGRGDPGTDEDGTQSR